MLAVGTLPLLVLEFRRDELTVADQRLLDIVNIIVLVAFGADYFVGLILTDDKRRYLRTEWINAVIVVTSILALIPSLGGFGAVRALRAARAFRGLAALARVLALGGLAARHGRQLLRRRAARLAAGLAGITWISAAVAFTMAEDVGRGRQHDSVVDAFWWSAATITTVGYGDVAPTTAVGRAAGVIAMVVGISTFAVVTARVAAFLVSDDDADETTAA